jgi:hypothetical protein
VENFEGKGQRDVTTILQRRAHFATTPNNELKSTTLMVDLFVHIKFGFLALSLVSLTDFLKDLIC